MSAEYNNTLLISASMQNSCNMFRNAFRAAKSCRLLQISYYTTRVS
jgi:hypothetical protein